MEDMLEIMFKKIIKEYVVKPYTQGEKTLNQAIEDYFQKCFTEYPKDKSKFDEARDKFDGKMIILTNLIQLKKLQDTKEDYKIIIDYLNEAIAEFQIDLDEEIKKNKAI